MTSMVESIAQHLPDSEVHVLVRTEHSSILENNPNIQKVHCINKGQKKYQNLRKMVRAIRAEGFNVVFNCHRFASSGYITLRSGAGVRIGFDKNPMAFGFTARAKHRYEQGLHELDRNHELLRLMWPDITAVGPRLYPSDTNYAKVTAYKEKPYFVLAPASVWFTKQYPIEGWIDLVKKLDGPVFIIGGPADKALGERLYEESDKSVINLVGDLSLLDSVALIDGAKALFANDSAPTHMGTAMNTPTHTMFCSTDESFGFGPKADIAVVHQETSLLDCRPCGIHGKKKCPEGHFLCSKFKVEPNL